MMARKQRSHGDGSVYQTKDGRWRIEVVVGTDHAGKPDRKVMYAKTEAEANAKRRAAVADHANGILVAGRSPTLAEWMTYWLDNIAAAKVKDRTLIGYRTYVRKWVLDTRVAKVRLNNLKPEHIEQLHKHARDAGLNETSVTQLHRIVSRALKVAVHRGRLATNPSTRLDAPTPAPFKPDVLTMDDARKLMRAADADPDGTRWIIALSLGLRQGERLALGWDEIDLKTGSLSVSRELYRMPWQHGCGEPEDEPTCGRRSGAWCPLRHSGGHFISPPKSEAGNRTMALPAELVDALKRHKAAQDKRRVEEGERWTGFVSANGVSVDLVFSRDNGAAIDSRSDWGAWKEFLATAGVPSIRVHDARHTAATVLLLMGVDGRSVMDMMGWSQMSMLTRYQHVLDEMKTATASKISQAFWAEPPAAEPEPDREPEKTADVVDFAAARSARRLGRSFQ